MKPRLSILSCWSQLGHWCGSFWVMLVLFSAEEGMGGLSTAMETRKQPGPGVLPSDSASDLN